MAESMPCSWNAAEDNEVSVVITLWYTNRCKLQQFCMDRNSAKWIHELFIDGG